MDINNYLYNSKENLIENNSIISNYKIKITLGKDKYEEIILNSNSNPEELAYNLCLKYNLKYKSLKSITKKLSSLQNTSYLLNSKTISNSTTSKNSTSKKISYKNILLTEKPKFNNNNIKKENEIFNNSTNKEVTSNNIKNMKKCHSINMNKSCKNSFNNILIKKLETNKKSNKRKNYKISSSKKIKDISILNSSKEKNIILATKVINQTIQKCLDLVENETRPFCNESNSEIKKGLKSSKSKSSKFFEKSEIKLGSFITNNENSNMINNIISNKENININNYTEDKKQILNSNNQINNSNTSKYYNDVDTHNNNNFEEKKSVLGEEYLRKSENNISPTNLYNNEIPPIEQEIDTSISKTEMESQNLTKNIIINDTNANTLVSYKDKNDINKNLAISESININLPSCINKEININILSNPKTSFNNKNFNNDNKYKKIVSVSNRYIPKYKNKIKNFNSYYGSDSMKNKTKNLINLFNDTSSKINNELLYTNKHHSIIYNNLKNKIINYQDKENIHIHTPSTYIKTCKNSLSSITVSDKNLLLNIKENNFKNNYLNKINNECLFDELYNTGYSSNNNTHLNIESSLNNKLYNNIILSKRVTNSVNIKDNTINEELSNENINKSNFDNYTNFREKNSRFKKINLNIYKKTKDSLNKINNYIKAENIKKYNEKRINKNRLNFEENKITDTLNSLTLNTTSNQNKYQSCNNINNILNKIPKNNIFSSHKHNKSTFFTNNFLNKNIFNKNDMNMNKKYVELKYLTENIISKNEIENCFKNIFNYICKNQKHDYLDVFSNMNTKNIPSEIYKPIQYVIKNCNNKRRFIPANEFIRKGYELFHYFSQNDKIALMNFNVFG